MLTRSQCRGLGSLVTQFVEPSIYQELTSHLLPSLQHTAVVPVAFAAHQRSIDMAGYHLFTVDLVCIAVLASPSFTKHSRRNPGGGFLVAYTAPANSFLNGRSPGGSLLR